MKADEAEAIMKKALDGSFKKYDGVTGGFTDRKKPKNYIPDHLLPQVGIAGHALTFSREEDDVMIEMRGRGLNWKAIRDALGRGTDGIRKRYPALCRERGIKPIKRVKRK